MTFREIAEKAVTGAANEGQAKRDAVRMCEGRWDETVAYNYATGYYRSLCSEVEAAWRASRAR